jgi:hypothetical protein
VLARAWVRVLWRAWTDRIPYDGNPPHRRAEVPPTGSLTQGVSRPERRCRCLVGSKRSAQCGGRGRFAAATD